MQWEHSFPVHTCCQEQPQHGWHSNPVLSHTGTNKLCAPEIPPQVSCFVSSKDAFLLLTPCKHIKFLFKAVLMHLCSGFQRTTEGFGSVSRNLSGARSCWFHDNFVTADLLSSLVFNIGAATPFLMPCTWMRFSVLVLACLWLGWKSQPLPPFSGNGFSVLSVRKFFAVTLEFFTFLQTFTWQEQAGCLQLLHSMLPQGHSKSHSRGGRLCWDWIWICPDHRWAQHPWFWGGVKQHLG